MTKDEQIHFVKEMCHNLAESVIHDIDAGKVPDNWDGIELRQLLSDRVEWSSILTGRRKRDYKNTVLVNGL